MLVTKPFGDDEICTCGVCVDRLIPLIIMLPPYPPRPSSEYRTLYFTGKEDEFRLVMQQARRGANDIVFVWSRDEDRIVQVRASRIQPVPPSMGLWEKYQDSAWRV